MASNNDDLVAGYTAKAGMATRSADVREMEDWLRSQGDPEAQKPQPPFERVRPLPEPKPVRQPAADSLGQPAQPDESSVAGTIMKNVAEIPRQAVAGVHDALHNATSFLEPLDNWLNEHVADLRYDPQDTIFSSPQTTTGAISRKVTEFLTGFIPATRALKAAGLTNAAANPIVAGALTDFITRDPSEGRLADLWKQAGLPQNILTDYMASKPDDTEVEARFKNAMESAGMGVAMEGVLRSARFIRAARAVPEVKQSEEEFLKAKYGELSNKDLALLGSDNKPVVGKVGKIVLNEEGQNMDPRSLVRAQKGEPLPEDWGVYINFSKIDSSDQVKFTIAKMAEAMKGQIDEAKRGVITQQETAKLADQLEMTVPELLARRQGQAFNAEEALAARQLWVASGERLLEAAKAASAPNAGAIDQYVFRRMMATHSAIQAEVLGARAEAARGLASWAIPAGSGVEKARAISQMMQAMGGTDTSMEMARRLTLLGEVGANPAAIARFAERGAAATTMDAIKEVWVNGLLSSPKTHAVNILSNTIVAFQQIYERAGAEAVRGVIGGQGVAPGESVAMAYGMVESYKDAWRMAAKALHTGETGWTLNKFDLPRTKALSAEAFNMSRETGAGRFVDYLGTAVNVPGRLLGAEDEFFKTIGYRMELHAQALRTATSEGHVGADLANRIVELTENAPESLKIAAADAALYNTFTNEVGWFGKAIMNLRSSGGPFNPIGFVLPFVRTPVNIARYSFERTPLAPLVGQWRADVAAGGARADIALARMATGTSIMLVAMDYANNGIVSGNGPNNAAVKEAQLRQGWKPYSVKLGDKWYSYNRTDPLGMTLGFAASISEAVRHGEIAQDDVDEWQEVAAMSIAAISQVAVSKTYLEGVAKLVEVISDPKRYSQKYIDDLFASFTPATALNASVKNMVDPVQREVNTPMEAVYARIAGLSSLLPPRRDLWGRPITTASGEGAMYDAVSPVSVSQQIDSPIDRELTRLQKAPERIAKQNTFDGVQANMRFYPKVYDQYTQLAGNELKHPAWGMGAKDYLDAVVSGKHPMSAAYNIMSDESRRTFIDHTIGEYRKLAQQRILADPNNRAFAEEIAKLKEFHQNARMPVLTGE